MAYRLPAHLHRNRHGVLYFRLSVPLDLRVLLGQREIYRSLNTSSVRDATDGAQALRIAFKAIFRQLSADPMSDTKVTAQRVWDDLQNSPDTRRRLKMASLQVVFDERQEQQDRQEAEIANLTERHDRELEIAMRAASSSPTAAPVASKSSGQTLKETWDAYKAEKIAAKAWKDGEDAAKNDYWPHVRALIELIGDKPISAVTADDANLFQTHVLNDPAGGSPSNREKRLTRAGALFRWARTKRTISDDFKELFRYPGRIEKNSYIAFDLADLKALFESDDYKENRFKTPWAYWIPLLGLFTGARLNELCQLTASDIGQHDGIPTIAILDDDETKRLKTTASRRIIPIHSKLIELGFLDYVSTITTGRIFPGLPESNARSGDFSKEPSRQFTAFRRKVKVGAQEGKSNKTFHSFRSTLISALRKADVPGDRRRRLAGHEANDVHDKNYDGGDALTMFNFKTLKEDIELAKFDAAFTPYR